MALYKIIYTKCILRIEFTNTTELPRFIIKIWIQSRAIIVLGHNIVICVHTK